jgi:hypothetical protein
MISNGSLFRDQNEKNMKSLYAVFALIIIGLSSSVYAHSNLVSSIPEDGSRIKEATEIQLVFSAPVKLTAMKLVNPAGTEMPLGSIPADMAESHTIALSETLAPGKYVASWRSISSDSHVVDGNLRFIVID